MHIDDLAKNTKAELADAMEAPEDLVRPEVLAASLSVDGSAIICDKPVVVGGKRAACRSRPPLPLTQPQKKDEAR